MSFQSINRVVAVGLLLLGGWAATSNPMAWGQEEIHRKAKTKIPPVYPELAKRNHITGVVKLWVAVAPSGAVKNAKVIGGNPVLADAALDVIKKWHFEAGPEESTGVVQFQFDAAH